MSVRSRWQIAGASRLILPAKLLLRRKQANASVFDSGPKVLPSLASGTVSEMKRIKVTAATAWLKHYL